MSLFRWANSADHEAIKKLFIRVRQAIENPSLFNWSMAQIEQELKASDFYISEASDGIFDAFIAHRVTGDFVEIMALGTDPLFTEQGLMESLLKDFVQKFSTKGLQITLEVHEQNFKALSLYKKCGFLEVRRRDSYYSDGGAALVMVNPS